MNSVTQAILDRAAYDVGTIESETHERDYWRDKSPGERMDALELMRQIIYGYDPTTTRLQRVLEIVELE